ncbi:MAG: PQQ-binding-like beta-propeller repeat protein, partial [Gemmataceae bacterium]
ALVRGGGRDGRAVVRKLLADDAPSVRLRTALALAQSGDKDGVPVLIDLLAVLPDEQVNQAETALFQLAGDSAPQTTLGMEAAEKKKCRDAWAAWWKVNAGRVDLTRMRAHALLGYTLICDTRANRVYEIDRHGKQRWAIDNVALPTDAVVLPGNRVLIAEYNANRVTERDFKGTILWEKPVSQPIGVQRLANGHAFITSAVGNLREVDRTGKDIYVVQNAPKVVRAAYRSRQGSIVCLTGTGECVLVDTTGKRLKSFDTHHVPADLGTMDLSPNGRILVTLQRGNKIVEYNAEGKKLRDVAAPHPSTATALPNGHILVASHQGQRVYELDRGGKIVWEHKGAGNAYRARRR